MLVHCVTRRGRPSHVPVTRPEWRVNPSESRHSTDSPRRSRTEPAASWASRGPVQRRAFWGARSAPPTGETECTLNVVRSRHTNAGGSADTSALGSSASFVDQATRGRTMLRCPATQQSLSLRTMLRQFLPKRVLPSHQCDWPSTGSCLAPKAVVPMKSPCLGIHELGYACRRTEDVGRTQIFTDV
jgi:hypothetical protein